MKHLLCLVATAGLAILAGCGGGQVVPPPGPAQSGVIEPGSTTQTTNTAQTSSVTPGTGRAPESATGTVTFNFSNLPLGAQPNAAVVYSNGTSQPVSRSTTLRLTGTISIVAVNSSLGGTIYAPTPATARQTKTIYANSSVQITISYLPQYGSLNIVPQGLPTGVGPNLTLSGPSGMDVSRGGVIQNLTPGNYVATIRPVSAGGKTYVPKSPTQSVVVSANNMATLTVAYADPAAVQASRVNAIINRAYQDNGRYVGIECKPWIQQVVLGATGIKVPSTIPNPDGFQWGSSLYFDAVSGGIRSARVGDIVQIQLAEAKTGKITPHTFLIIGVNAPNLTVIESNYTKTDTVMVRPNSVKPTPITFTSIEQYHYTVYRINGNP